jgi:hypothetical protein
MIKGLGIRPRRTQVANQGFKKGEDDFGVMGSEDATGRRAPAAARVRFFVGIALMALSFLVYPAYSLIILFLPVSGKIKAGVIIAASLLSWGIFSAGIYLAGREGYDWLKGLWKR